MRYFRANAGRISEIVSRRWDRNAEGMRHEGSRSESEAHIRTLKTRFKDHPPHTVAQAQKEIERLTGIRRSPTQVRQFIKRIGMKIRKVGAIPGKAMDDNKLCE